MNSIHTTRQAFDLNVFLQGILDGTHVPTSLCAEDHESRLRLLTCRKLRGSAWELSYQGVPSLRIFLRIEHDARHGLLTWQVRLFADKNTPRLSQIRLLDIALPHQDARLLRGISGGFLPKLKDDGSHFPPEGLKPWERQLEVGEAFSLGCGGCGKSSSQQIPIWFHHNEHGGIWFGPEWSGTWRLDVARDAGGSRLQLMLPDLDFRMYQGEEIALPSFSLAAYTGSRHNGQQHLRRTIRDHFMPRDEHGNPPTPAVVHQGLFGQEDYYNENGIKEEMARAAALGCEYYIFNAHWYDAPPKFDGSDPMQDMPWGKRPVQRWVSLMGDYELSQEKFPSGPDALNEYVRSLGMKLGYWIDPRFGNGCRSLNERPDIGIPPDQSYGNGDFHRATLIDLSREAGCDWLENALERIITTYHGEWIWLDMNQYPRHNYWNLHEEPDRKGLMELGYYQGLYEVFDRVMARHPSVRVETCANGGMVIDLGMIRRSHSIWINDWVGFEGGHQAYEPDVNRNHRSGAGHWLPGALVQNSMYIPWAVTQSDEIYDPIHYVSQFAGTVNFGQRMKCWKQSDHDTAKRCVEIYKQIRHLLYGDYTQLFPMPERMDVWDGWQFHDPDDDEGVIILFRLPECTQTETICALELKQPRDYRFETLLGNAQVRCEDNGVTVSVPERCAVIQYSKGT